MTMRTSKAFRILACILVVFLFLKQESLSQYAGLDTLQLKTIFAEPLLPGVRPSPARFSPDNSKIYFSWNDSSYTDTGLYSVALDGTGLMPVEDSDILPRSVLSPDQSVITYSEDNSLWIAGLDGSNARIIFTSKQAIRSLTWSPDSRSVAFVTDGDVWTASIVEANVRQLTRRAADEPSYSINGWGLDGNKLIVRQTDRSHFQEVFFPRYVPEMVEPGGSMRGQPINIIHTLNLEGELNTILDGPYYILNTSLSADSKFFAIDFTTHAMKERTIMVVDLENNSSINVHTETTEGWIYSPLMNVSFAPEGDLLFFTSEETGWAHLYTVRANGTRKNRLTSGQHEVVWAEWIDSSNIVLASTERDSGLRDIYTLNVNTTSTSRLTQSDAFRYNFRLSNDKRFVVYSSTTWNIPSDMYVMDIRRPRNKERLTNSIPERFKEIEWQEPEYIHFTSRDEVTRLTMDVLKPHDFNPEETYPVVIFAHGAGSLQNVFQGWSRSYPREYMFHQYLNKHGYVVVEVDFRHSTGYGRAFREDVTNWMGKFELEDIIDGLEYLNRQHGYLDMENIGIYGGSYGGFMALYAISNAPDYFHAGAALRAVTNWVNYFHANPGYTKPRLGHPDEFPEHYERSSPISFADTLSRPALILHGLVDDNVGFQDAAQYIDKLIRSGNTNFDMMMYPSERHAFRESTSWHDQYLRIFNFFERHLKIGE